MELFDVVVVGAGAAGLFCAAQAGQLGLRVLLVDSGKKPGRKILISGGGRCNFTNMYAESATYLSQNPHFCKSALARYTQWDFIHLVNRYGIAYHEKILGQLFCDYSAQQIVDLLMQECERGKVKFRLCSTLQSIIKKDKQFILAFANGILSVPQVVISCGGLSMPRLGSSPFGYQIAQQFGLNVLPTRAALVPFTLHKPLLKQTQTLSGVSLPVVVTAKNCVSFKESLLFTYRGLSGPAILQLSNYWLPGEVVTINLLPQQDLGTLLAEQRAVHQNQSLQNTLALWLPKRLVECLKTLGIIPDASLKQLQPRQIAALTENFHAWRVQPNGTEGYRTAEATLGGVDTCELSSKTMETSKVPGLYFIGEVVDVTGWLGGYNFQWAWSSAWACAQALL
ncbi:MAG: NAD(P)/FAD-dependent oxidoreductase [Candidatus Malihini olakiniferum]